MAFNKTFCGLIRKESALPFFILYLLGTFKHKFYFSLICLISKPPSFYLGGKNHFGLLNCSSHVKSETDSVLVKYCFFRRLIFLSEHCHFYNISLLCLSFLNHKYHLRLYLTQKCMFGQPFAKCVFHWILIPRDAPLKHGSKVKKDWEILCIMPCNHPWRFTTHTLRTLKNL